VTGRRGRDAGEQERGSAARDRTDGFSALMNRALSDATRFGHREHIHLTWLAVRTYGTARATDVVSDGIQRTARYEGVPQKYNATVSRAWVELVGHHVSRSSTAEFDDFINENPALLEKKLLTRFYRSATLAGDAARRGWLEPDLAPFPWT
jgi:hypothetical protein